MKLLLVLVIASFISIEMNFGQSQDPLSQEIAKGLAEFRQDIFQRKAVYVKKLKRTIESLDTSSLSERNKKLVHEFIQKDIKEGAKSNSLELYDLLPDPSPYRNIYVEQYIANNQDYQIDKTLQLELRLIGLLTESNKINRLKIAELIKDFDFLTIENADRILLYNAGGGSYAMLLGYGFEGIDITVHNQYLEDHYLSLDRMDRYPNINNGNLIEFLHNEDARITIKGELWDKIIIRDAKFLEQSPGYKLNSLHDNLTEDGHLYLLHEVDDNTKACNSKLDEPKIIKVMERADFEVIDQLKLGCLTYFKFKSTKVLK